MNIFIILGIIWVGYVGYGMIKKEGKRGGMTLAFLILAGLLWASGNKFGFDGGIAAVILSVVFVVGSIIYDKQIKR